MPHTIIQRRGDHREGLAVRGSVQKSIRNLTGPGPAEVTGKILTWSEVAFQLPSLPHQLSDSSGFQTKLPLVSHKKKKKIDYFKITITERGRRSWEWWCTSVIPALRRVAPNSRPAWATKPDPV